MIPTNLVSGDGRQVSVSDDGSLSVSVGAYDAAEYRELGVINTAYNFYKPLDREQFVITGIIMYGDKQVSSSTNATVIIYEADSPETTTADRILIQVEVGQNQSIPFPGMRLLCNYGVYINAKTDDDDVHLTIMGHYVDLNGQEVVTYG